jgi:TolB-like protein
MLNFNKIGFLLFIFSLVQNAAQEPVKPGIVIIPFQSNGLDTVYTHTAESIFRIEFNKLSKINIVSRRMTLEHLPEKYCFSVECAKEAGNKLEADQVFACNLSALGEKIIVQYFLLSLPEGNELINDQTTSRTIEDLEMVMKRVAKSIVENEPLSKGAQVGNITLNESKKNILRKGSNKNIGLSFGYLYPQKGYDKTDRSLVVDLRIEYELETYSVGMLLGIRKGFAMNVYSSYLVSKKDLCPYIGGAFGFHWISHTYSYDYDGTDIREDGFEVTARTGIIAFRTYNFQVILNLEYIYTFNDYDDQALVFTIGIL